MIFSSQHIENAVREFSKLPGIGKKTALRLALHLLKMEIKEVDEFTNALHRFRYEVKFCKICNNISDIEICQICNSPERNKNIICIVENIRDVIAIESTQQYNGLYHVLGGILSPIDGIGPDQLFLDSLYNRVKENKISELVIALSPNIEGDTTAFYITRQLKDMQILITSIARGIAFGGELEYADEMTLAKSISRRLPISNYLSIN